jgi:hypothetical protein
MAIFAERHWPCGRPTQHRKAMKTDTTKTKPKKQPKPRDDGRSHAPDCSRIEFGCYANGKGAWIEILDVQLPGYPNYDGGMTGVSVIWGTKRWFVAARDEADFWSQFPYRLLKDCFCSENSIYS